MRFAHHQSDHHSSENGTAGIQEVGYACRLPPDERDLYSQPVLLGGIEVHKKLEAVVQPFGGGSQAVVQNLARFLYPSPFERREVGGDLGFEVLRCCIHLGPMRSLAREKRVGEVVGLASP